MARQQRENAGAMEQTRQDAMTRKEKHDSATRDARERAHFERVLKAGGTAQQARHEEKAKEVGARNERERQEAEKKAMAKARERALAQQSRRAAEAQQAASERKTWAEQTLGGSKKKETTMERLKRQWQEWGPKGTGWANTGEEQSTALKKRDEKRGWGRRHRGRRQRDEL